MSRDHYINTLYKNKMDAKGEPNMFDRSWLNFPVVEILDPLFMSKLLSGCCLEKKGKKHKIGYIHVNDSLISQC